MARASAAVLAVLLALASPAAADSPRDQQWQYFATNGSGQPIPTAIFLSWDYSHVLFVATCDASTATLKLRHPAYWPLVTTVNPDDLRARFPGTLPLALARGDRRIDGAMHLENSESELVATFAVTPALLALLMPDGDNELMIDVENETGDPWFAGAAGPLYRLARDCVAEPDEVPQAEPPIEPRTPPTPLPPGSPVAPDQSWAFIDNPTAILTAMGNATEKVDCGRTRILARIEWTQQLDGRRDNVRVSTFAPPFGPEQAGACPSLEAGYRDWFLALPDSAFVPAVATVARRFELTRAPADLPPPAD